MGMIPELPIAVLACARIGAVHSVIFGGFSAQSIADRVNDAQAALVVTCDGSLRGAKEVPLKPVVDEALGACPSVQKVVVYAHTGTPVSMKKGRDLWWADEIERVNAMGNPFVEAEEMDAEDMLFILYTSGSTGKPKGVVHTCAGYMVWTNYTFINAFQYRPGDVHFCTADIGWITGHSYLLYGPLSAGATTVMFEGIPTWPDAGRLWDIVDRHRVSILYTAPTAIRSLMGFGLEPIAGKSLTSLRVLGTVGEPINVEAWNWYGTHIGGGRCPVVDTWWQTETGGVLISNLAGVTPAKATFATLPMPGVDPVLVDEQGEEIAGNDVSGNLCIRKPTTSAAAKPTSVRIRACTSRATAACATETGTTASPAAWTTYSTSAATASERPRSKTHSICTRAWSSLRWSGFRTASKARGFMPTSCTAAASTTQTKFDGTLPLPSAESLVRLPSPMRFSW
jgi:acetyl-CoA synthetase